jgi:hypothetical protein
VPLCSTCGRKLLSTILIHNFTAGTFEDPIIVRSAGEELQCGCTGSPADSHVVRWCVVCSVTLSFQFVVLTNGNIRCLDIDHTSVVMNAAASTKWSTSGLLMTHTTLTTGTRNPKPWRITSSRNTGTDERRQQFGSDWQAHCR